MGREFKIEIKPTVESLEDACDAISVSNEWRRIPTSLIDFPEGIGIQDETKPVDANWPQCVDLCRESNGSYYAVAHSNAGVRFLNMLADQLRAMGYVVTIDPDHY